jgi:hypothetical protein
VGQGAEPSPLHCAPCAAAEPLPEPAVLQPAQVHAEGAWGHARLLLLEGVPRAPHLAQAKGEASSVGGTHPPPVPVALALDGGGFSLGARYGAVAAPLVLVGAAGAGWGHVFPVVADVAGALEGVLSSTAWRAELLPLGGPLGQQCPRPAQCPLAHPLRSARTAQAAAQARASFGTRQSRAPPQPRIRHASPRLAVEHERSVGTWAAALKSLGMLANRNARYPSSTGRFC